MRKTLADMGTHLKNIILPEPAVGVEILAFRAFLHRFCDVLITEGELYDKPKKYAKEHLSAIFYNFPFLDNVKKLLLNIGVLGELEKDTLSLIANGSIFNAKLSNIKNIECLQFLISCGMRFEYIEKKKLSEIETIKISYPDNPAMLAGLKIMALAETKFGTNLNHNILMRCDYRVLNEEEPDVLSILKETITSLPPDVQDFVLRLHQLHLDRGLNCAVEIRGFWKKIKYSRGSREIWGINTSLNNGYELTVKAQNTHKYADAVTKLSLDLQKLIAKGYGCGRKREGIEKCDSGCEGLRISLDDTVLDISEGIETWLRLESS